MHDLPNAIKNVSTIFSNVKNLHLTNSNLHTLQHNINIELRKLTDV